MSAVALAAAPTTSEKLGDAIADFESAYRDFE